MNGEHTRPLWSAGASVLAHGLALAALVWLAVPRPPAVQLMPQIELLPPLPIVPMPQDAKPSPINLPISPQPTPPAMVSPPAPVVAPPPVLAGVSTEDVQPLPKSEPKRMLKQTQRRQPIPTKALEHSPAPPTAAPVNGNEIKKDTVIADAHASPQPAGPSPDYIGLVRGRLEQVKQYPLEARTRQQEGTVVMRFTLDRSGRVLDAQLAQSSGVPSLDNEARAMIERASPFPPFPPSFDRANWELIVPIPFSLKRP